MSIERKIGPGKSDEALDTAVLGNSGDIVNPDESPENLKAVRDFQDKIREIALNTHSLILRGIKVEELGGIDMHFYNKFKKGELSISEIKHQKDVLAHVPVKATIQLLDWMRLQIERGAGVPVTLHK